MGHQITISHLKQMTNCSVFDLSTVSLISASLISAIISRRILLDIISNISFWMPGLVNLRPFPSPFSNHSFISGTSFERGKLSWWKLEFNSQFLSSNFLAREYLDAQDNNRCKYFSIFFCSFNTLGDAKSSSTEPFTWEGIDDPFYSFSVTLHVSISKWLLPKFGDKDLGTDVNESLNDVIWKKCSKTVCVDIKTFHRVVASATNNHNGGGLWVLLLFNKLKMKRGQFHTNYLAGKDADP